MPTPPRRRWFQFGLVGLFVAVTLFAAFAAFVAYHVNWIRERHAIINNTWAEETRALSMDYRDNLDSCMGEALPSPPAPGLLWLFDELGYGQILVWFGKLSPDRGRQLTPEELSSLKQIERLFPEAKVVGMPHIYPVPIDSYPSAIHP